jgi:hypothetical protein
MEADMASMKNDILERCMSVRDSTIALAAYEKARRAAIRAEIRIISAQIYYNESIRKNNDEVALLRENTSKFVDEIGKYNRKFENSPIHVYVGNNDLTLKTEIENIYKAYQAHVIANPIPVTKPVTTESVTAAPPPSLDNLRIQANEAIHRYYSDSTVSDTESDDSLPELNLVEN